MILPLPVNDTVGLSVPMKYGSSVKTAKANLCSHVRRTPIGPDPDAHLRSGKQSGFDYVEGQVQPKRTIF